MVTMPTTTATATSSTAGTTTGVWPIYPCRLYGVGQWERLGLSRINSWPGKNSKHFVLHYISMGNYSRYPPPASYWIIPYWIITICIEWYLLHSHSRGLLSNKHDGPSDRSDSLSCLLKQPSVRFIILKIQVKQLKNKALSDIWNGGQWFLGDME